MKFGIAAMADEVGRWEDDVGITIQPWAGDFDTTTATIRAVNKGNDDSCIIVTVRNNQNEQQFFQENEVVFMAYYGHRPYSRYLGSFGFPFPIS